MRFSNPYIYLNDAATWQDPIDGHGVTAKNELRKASEQYGPDGMFQKQVPVGLSSSFERSRGVVGANTMARCMMIWRGRGGDRPSVIRWLHARDFKATEDEDQAQHTYPHGRWDHAAIGRLKNWNGLGLAVN
jgi:hypothetical protein